MKRGYAAQMAKGLSGGLNFLSPYQTTGYFGIFTSTRNPWPRPDFKKLDPRRIF
jgi:hypothetical protein